MKVVWYHHGIKDHKHRFAFNSMGVLVLNRWIFSFYKGSISVWKVSGIEFVPHDIFSYPKIKMSETISKDTDKS